MGYGFTPLPRERELQAESEVLRSRRVTARRKQRRVGLAVIIEAQCKQARHCIISRERQFESRIAAAGRTGHRGNVAAD